MLIYSAVDQYNLFHPENQRLEKKTDTVLFSRTGFTGSGTLDSIGLINFLVLVEEKIKHAFSDAFVLDIQKVLLDKEKQLKDVKSFSHYLATLISEK